MGFDLDVTIPVLTVFIQGIFSFFSPCILPIIPLYIGYLSGGTVTILENGERKYNQKKVIVHTIFFIIGVSFAFFILGIGFSQVGKFFIEKQMIFSRIGGILIILLGFMQLGVFDKPFKGREFKLPMKIDILKMNPLTALIMGFIFSFAWTPCVGPALSTVLIMVSSANSTGTGLFLMAVYTIGFTLPFLLGGIFTTKCLNLFKKYNKVVAYTVKIGGVIMILMGAMMFSGMMNGVTDYLSTVENSTEENNVIEENNSSKEEVVEEETEESEDVKVPAIDFELKDQFGNTHKLSDYKGKVIFLNFWATWCPPCKAEMPDIQKLYESYGYNKEDVIILGVASPKSNENQNTDELEEEGIIEFLEENEYSYPTLMDPTGMLQYEYGISAYPTTFMIDVDSNIYGYVPGMLTYEIMESIIKQTIEQK